MGRQLRMVPKNWEHPKNEDGKYKPLMGYEFTAQLEGWKEEHIQWHIGFRKNHFDKKNPWVSREGDELKTSYRDWAGGKPKKQDYMPEWKEQQKTHFQMYEDTTEGTPISPVMDNPEELAQWLVDNNASAFGDMTATYQEWLGTIKAGWSPGMVMTNGKLEAGTAIHDKPRVNE